MITVTEFAFTSRAITDVVRARAFYEGFLGLQATMALEFENGHWWIEYELPGGTLAISNAWIPSGHGVSTIIAFEVPDLDKALAEVHADRVPITFGPLDTPVCRMFGISDPDGNGVTLHQRKATD